MYLKSLQSDETILDSGISATATGVAGTGVATAAAVALGPIGWLFAGAAALSAVALSDDESTAVTEEITQESQFDKLIKYLDTTSVNFIHEKFENWKKYQFELGHIVTKNSFYIEDLIFPEYLIPLQDYQFRLYKEQMVILKQLVGTLGAKFFQLIDFDLDKQYSEDSMKFNFGQIASFAGTNAQFKGKSLSKTYERKFGIPEYQPYVSPKIQHWVNFNQDLRSLCNSRFESNVIEDTVTISLNEKTSNACDVALNILGYGASHSSSTTTICSSTWIFKVKFYSKQELSHLPKHPSQR